jgi:hypothetical protein
LSPAGKNESGPDPDSTLERLREEASAAGVPVAWRPAGDTGAVLAELVVECSPAPASSLDAAFALEAVLEGFLCHQGAPRLFDPDDDDLALLTGDLLYALGLRAVASGGDTAAVEALAELIGGSAALAAEGRRPALAALWLAQTVVLTDPSSDEWRSSIRALREGADVDGYACATQARERAASAGADRAFDRATDALQSMMEAVPERG